MRSLPPNPFSELTEKMLEEYKSVLEQRQLGQDGMILPYLITNINSVIMKIILFPPLLSTVVMTRAQSFTWPGPIDNP